MNFFDNVKRNRAAPFWSHPQLKIKEEYRTEPILAAPGGGDEGQAFLSEPNLSEYPAARSDDDDLLALPDEDDIEGLLLYTHNIATKERAEGSARFLTGLKQFLRPLADLRAEIKRIDARRTPSTTWKRTKFPFTMFYKGLRRSG